MVYQDCCIFASVDTFNGRRPSFPKLDKVRGFRECVSGVES